MYKVGELVLVDDKNQTQVPRDDSFWELLSVVQKGGVYTRNQLEGEMNSLIGSGMFADLHMDAVAKEDGSVRVSVPLQEGQCNCTLVTCNSQASL